MSKTEVSGKQIKDGSIELVDLSSAVSSDITQLKSDVATLQTDVAAKADAGSLATVATSGSYDDLSDKPSIPSLTQVESDISSLDGRVTSVESDVATLQSSSVANLSDLGDVGLTTPVTGEFLKYNVDGWTNSALPVASASQSGVLTTEWQVIGGDKSFADKVSVGTNVNGTRKLNIHSASGINGFQITYGNENPAVAAGFNMLYDGDSAYFITYGQKSFQFYPNDVPSGEFDINGKFSAFRTAFVRTHSASLVPFVVRGAENQAADLFTLQNDGGAGLFTIDKDGSVSAGTVPVARVTGLATVATSGSYNDLSNTPSLFSGSYTDLTNKPTLGSFTTLTSPASEEFLKYDGSAWINAVLPTADGSTSGVVSTGTQTFAGAKTFSTSVNATRYVETVANAFNTSLAPSSGTLTVDTATGNVVLGALNAAVTTWAFTNVPTDNSKVTTVTAVLAGNASYTYGDACSVNGSSVSGGIMWSGGTAPTATAGTDIITFVIVKDSAGTVKVFGSATTNFS